MWFLFGFLVFSLWQQPAIKTKGGDSVPLLVPPLEALALPYPSERATQKTPREYICNHNLHTLYGVRKTVTYADTP